jgi:large subunit ribosomal protein L25
MAIEVIAQSRASQGKGESRRLRRAGRVPGIVYGAGQGPEAIELDHNALFHQIKLEGFRSSILSLNLNGTKEQVLLRDVQMHPYKPIVQHVDFQRVAKDQKIHMGVPLHFINEDVAPGVKIGGGIVGRIIAVLEVTCLPADLPEFIDVDVSQMQVNDTLHVSDLKLPSGVDAVAVIRGEDPPVVTIQLPRAVVEEEAAPTEEAEAAAAAAAAPAPTEKKEAEKKEKE